MESATFLIDRYGLPTLITIIVLYWVARQLLEPLIARHAEYLTTTAAAFTSLAISQQQMAESLAQQAELLSRIDCLKNSPPTRPPAAAPDRLDHHEPRP